MAISFTCPNGHRLSCADDRAGTSGKCPKCGGEYVVPKAGGSSPSAAGRGGDTSPAARGTIVFLCPNGHKLNGPASLQGRTGQCPHCNERFQIPFLDETESSGSAAAAAEEEYNEFAAFEQGIEEFPSADAPAAAMPSFSTAAEDAIEEFALSFPEEPIDPFVLPAGGTVAAPPARDARQHPCQRLFARLWEEKQHGATVRIVLAAGETIEPQWYAPRMSTASHGVFAQRDTKGRYTVVAVAWDAMQRIEAAPLGELPENQFE